MMVLLLLHSLSSDLFLDGTTRALQGRGREAPFLILLQLFTPNLLLLGSSTDLDLLNCDCAQHPTTAQHILPQIDHAREEHAILRGRNCMLSYRESRESVGA